MNLAPAIVDDCVDRALREDLGETGDWTTSVAVAGAKRGRAEVIAKADGVIAGLPFAERVFLASDPEAHVEDVCGGDGASVRSGDVILRASGSAAALLVAERTALNFLQRLSGIATATAEFVAAVAGTGARILDTRKTTPTLRMAEKYAVAAGGGENHRIGLFDQILLKENHFAWAGEPYEEVVRRAARAVGDRPGAPVIAEARDLDEACAAVRGGAGVVLLDNFESATLADAVAVVRRTASELGRDISIEASGGINLQTVRAYAEAGVDRISLGMITHSARSLDLSMLVQAEAD